MITFIGPDIILLDLTEGLTLFAQSVNGLAQVPFEGVLVEAYKGTRRKHNMKFKQIDHTTS